MRIQRNYPLYLGVALSMLVVALAVFGPVLAPHDPLQEHGLIWWNGVPYGGPPLDRPLPPFTHPDYLLGTDEIMRDVFSRILWAVRPTLLLCAIIACVRVVVGTLVGILAGWWGGPFARVMEALVAVSVSVPLLALAVALLLAIGLGQGLLAFVLALSITSWCDTAVLVRTRTQAVRTAPYIESARAIGQRTGGILWQHVLPQLRPLLPMLLAFELAATLLLVAELGYLGYYLGGGTLYRFTTGSGAEVFSLRPGAAELGQLLSDFFKNLYRTPWIAMTAGSVVFVSLAAFSLLGEGLRRQLDVTRPRSVPGWQWVPWTLLSYRPRVRWTIAGGGIVVVLVSVLLLRPAALSFPFGTVGASLPSSSAMPQVSTTSVPVEQLGAIDLEAVVTQNGVLPYGYTLLGRASRRVPDVFRAVPPPVQSSNSTLKGNSTNAGQILILLYASVAERDTAYQHLVDEQVQNSTNVVLEQPIPQPSSNDQPVVGERSVSIRGAEGASIGVVSHEMIFARCGAAVYIRLVKQTTDGLADAVIATASALDQQLAPQVCQPQ